MAALSCASPVRLSPFFFQNSHRDCVSLTSECAILDRLRTIISYDRICVMHDGNIAEFDAPGVLYEQNGVFRAMCDRSNITRADIRRARMVRSFRDSLAVLKWRHWTQWMPAGARLSYTTHFPYTRP